MLPTAKLALERIRAFDPARTETVEAVSLVFACDQNYVPFTAVTLASVLKHYSDPRPLRVYLLLDERLSSDDLERYEALQKLHPYELTQIPVDANKFASVRTTPGISIATYFRLGMHKLLPPECTKVIYLDSDLIIRDSIHELYDQDLRGNLFLGVEDSISQSYNAKFGIPTDGHHANAGVLVVNVEMMRAIDFDELVDTYLTGNRYRVILGDQQIIAELFHHSVGYLPIRWNVHGPMFSKEWGKQEGASNMDPREASDAIRDPAIIHYTLKRKPWMSMEHPRSSDWFTYLNLTRYADVVERPPKQPSKNGSTTSQGWWQTLQGKLRIFGGYRKSIYELRKTRLSTQRALNQNAALRKELRAHAGKRTQHLQDDLSLRLKRTLEELAVQTPRRFNAVAAIDSIPEDSLVLSNVMARDLDGGYAENVKTLFRTNRFTTRRSEVPSAVVLLSQRLLQPEFWRCVTEARLYDRPILFLEVAHFAGYASIFDSQATLTERRAMGFIVDDMGYYFDARQASRLERTLNDPTYKVSPEHQLRATNAIAMIVQHCITKYNKYVNTHWAPATAEEELDGDCVLVVDQKKGDASIEFAGATDDSFYQMMDAAVAENPGKTVYFKRHPDNIQRSYNAYRDRNRKSVKVVPDGVPVNAVLDKCSTVYTVSSQVGFEALLRGKKVVCFGIPFFAGWGLTDDRAPVPRRRLKRSLAELFYVTCIELSIYIDPFSGERIELEQHIHNVLSLRAPDTAVSSGEGSGAEETFEKSADALAKMNASLA